MASDLADPGPAIDSPPGLVLALVVGVDVPDDRGWTSAGELANTGALIRGAPGCENLLLGQRQVRHYRPAALEEKDITSLRHHIRFAHCEGRQAVNRRLLRNPQLFHRPRFLVEFSFDRPVPGPCGRERRGERPSGRTLGTEALAAIKCTEPTRIPLPKAVAGPPADRGVAQHESALVTRPFAFSRKSGGQMHDNVIQ